MIASERACAAVALLSGVIGLGGAESRFGAWGRGASRAPLSPLAPGTRPTVVLQARHRTRPRTAMMSDLCRASAATISMAMPASDATGTPRRSETYAVMAVARRATAAQRRAELLAAQFPVLGST